MRTNHCSNTDWLDLTCSGQGQSVSRSFLPSVPISPRSSSLSLLPKANNVVNIHQHSGTEHYPEISTKSIWKNTWSQPSPKDVRLSPCISFAGLLKWRRWPEQQKFHVCQLWKLDISSQGECVPFLSLLHYGSVRHSLTSTWYFSCCFTLSSLYACLSLGQISSFDKDTNHIGFRLSIKTSS